MTDFIFYLNEGILYSEAGNHQLKDIHITFYPYLEICFYNFFVSKYDFDSKYSSKENIKTINLKHVIKLPFDKIVWSTKSIREKDEKTRIAYEKLILFIFLLLYIDDSSEYLDFSEKCYLINGEFPNVYSLIIIKESTLEPLYESENKILQSSLSIELKNRILFLQ